MEDKNEAAMHLQLDLVDEDRATVEQRLARYQDLMSKHYNAKVRHRDFQIEDLVLRKVIGAAKDPSQGKLGPNWEGPYRITSWKRKGTYHFGNNGRKEASAPMEYGTPSEILPVEMMVEFPLFPSLFIFTSLSLKFFIIFFV